jgi:glycosyltransferase involved in cell wall biosynthesis
MKKKLSVVIPTLNRLELLKVTLESLIPQIERNLDQVDFQISINNSDDETADFINELSKKKEYIKYKNFNSRVGISDSFSRSIDMCEGEYVILYGDDDIPAPFFIESILEVLNDQPKIGLLHFNRIVGSDSDSHSMNKLRMEESLYRIPYETHTLQEFINTYTVSPGFISSMVFKRECWKLGETIDNTSHYGYEFLSRIYAGIYKLDSSECTFINFPIIIQRLIKKREWNDLWPKYWLIGIPNLLNTLDKEEITDKVIETWYKKLDASTIKFIYYLFWASSYKQIYRPLISEINKNQKSVFRKVATVIIINFAPKFVFSTIRKFIYK